MAAVTPNLAPPPIQQDPVVPLVEAITGAAAGITTATDTLIAEAAKLTNGGTVRVIVGEELPRALNQLTWQRWWWMSLVMAAFAVVLATPRCRRRVVAPTNTDMHGPAQRRCILRVLDGAGEVTDGDDDLRGLCGLQGSERIR